MGCGAPSEGVQLYINQLPGVTMGNIAALADDEQETFLGVWADIVLRSMKKFEILVKANINKCFKISSKVEVECLVCENADLFDVALWYLHGAEVMIERTSTDELNRFTTIDLEKAERLKEDFYIEFESALNDAVNSMDVTDSDCLKGCLSCNDSVKWVFQTP